VEIDNNQEFSNAVLATNVTHKNFISGNIVGTLTMGNGCYNEV
jgi:hypothetical protein